MEVTLLYCYALESNMEIYQYKLYKKRNAFQRLFHNASGKQRLCFVGSENR